MQPALEVAFPEIEELGEIGKAGRQIQVLPDVALQNGLVVGHPVEDFGGRDAIVAKLRNKAPVHSGSLTRHAYRNSHASLTENQQNSFHIKWLAAMPDDCCQANAAPAKRPDGTFLPSP